MSAFRRSALAALSVSMMLTTAVARAETIEVTSSPVAAFEPNAPQTTAFGPLRFLGGLQMESSDARFGGLSGVEVSPDGTTLLMVSDTGDMLRARLVETDGRPTGLADVAIAQLTDADNAPLGGKYGSDAESLRAAPGHGLDRVLVGFERDNRVVMYDVSEAGSPRYVRTLDVPKAVRRLPHNKGLEAIAVMPGDGADAGRTVMFGEGPNEDGRLDGWILDAGGRSLGAFTLATSNDFSATDAVFLDTGDLIVLERRFSPLTGVAVRLVRIAADEIVPDAAIDGEQLFTARMNFVVDNMEGIAFHRDEQGRAILTIVSDDNFNILQRNLLLRFELVE